MGIIIMFHNPNVKTTEKEKERLISLIDGTIDEYLENIGHIPSI